MNDNAPDTSSLMSELDAYGKANPNASKDIDEEFTVGDDLTSDKYSGNSDVNNKIKTAPNSQQEHDEVLDELGYKADVPVTKAKNTRESFSEEPIHPVRERRERPNIGLGNILNNAVSAVIVGAICYFIILPMLLFAVRSIAGIQPQWYDNYQDISDKYFSSDNKNLDMKEPIKDLKSIRDHVTDTVKDVTGYDIRPKLNEGKTIILAPFVVGETGKGIRVFINGEEYSLEVPAVDMLKEESSNRAKIEISVLDREIVGTKFISFERVVEGGN